MNRRRLLELLSMGIAGIALDQAIPFNRVWSFPKEILMTGDRFTLANVNVVNPAFCTARFLATELAEFYYRDHEGGLWTWQRTKTKPIKIGQSIWIGKPAAIDSPFR